MSHTEWGVRFWEGDDQIERTVDFGRDRVGAEDLHNFVVRQATVERRAELPARRHGAELLVRHVGDWAVRIAAV